MIKPRVYTRTDNAPTYSPPTHTPDNPGPVADQSDILWLMRAAIGLLALGSLFWVGCGSPASDHPSTDPASAILDPSEVSPTPETMKTLPEQLVGTFAPNFELPTEDGKPTRREAMQGGKAALIYFIQRDCPCCVDAAPFVTKLTDALRGQVTLIGLINGDPKQAAQWKKANDFPGIMACDPEEKVIRDFRVETGVAFFLLQKDGKIVHVAPGYSVDAFGELLTQAESLMDQPAARVSFEGAPKDLTSGCFFKWPSGGGEVPTHEGNSSSNQ